MQFNFDKIRSTLVAEQLLFSKLTAAHELLRLEWTKAGRQLTKTEKSWLQNRNKYLEFLDMDIKSIRDFLLKNDEYSPYCE